MDLTGLTERQLPSLPLLPACSLTPCRKWVQCPPWGRLASTTQMWKTGLFQLVSACEMQYCRKVKRPSCWEGTFLQCLDMSERSWKMLALTNVTLNYVSAITDSFNYSTYHTLDFWKNLCFTFIYCRWSHFICMLGLCINYYLPSLKILFFFFN